MDTSQAPASAANWPIVGSGGRLQVAVREMTEAMQSYRFSDLTRAIYDFVWRDYCDWYLELAKVRLQGGDPQARRAAQEHLVWVLEIALRAVAPHYALYYRDLVAGPAPRLVG